MALSFELQSRFIVDSIPDAPDAIQLFLRAFDNSADAEEENPLVLYTVPTPARLAEGLHVQDISFGFGKVQFAIFTNEGNGFYDLVTLPVATPTEWRALSYFASNLTMLPSNRFVISTHAMNVQLELGTMSVPFDAIPITGLMLTVILVPDFAIAGQVGNPVAYSRLMEFLQNGQDEQNIHIVLPDDDFEVHECRHSTPVPPCLYGGAGDIQFTAWRPDAQGVRDLMPQPEYTRLRAAIGIAAGVGLEPLQSDAVDDQAAIEELDDMAPELMAGWLYAYERQSDPLSSRTSREGLFLAGLRMYSVMPYLSEHCVGAVPPLKPDVRHLADTLFAFMARFAAEAEMDELSDRTLFIARAMYRFALYGSPVHERLRVDVVRLWRARHLVCTYQYASSLGMAAEQLQILNMFMRSLCPTEVRDYNPD